MKRTPAVGVIVVVLACLAACAPAGNAARDAVQPLPVDIAAALAPAPAMGDFDASDQLDRGETESLTVSAARARLRPGVRVPREAVVQRPLRVYADGAGVQREDRHFGVLYASGVRFFVEPQSPGTTVREELATAEAMMRASETVFEDGRESPGYLTTIAGTEVLVSPEGTVTSNKDGMTYKGAAGVRWFKDGYRYTLMSRNLTSEQLLTVALDMLE